MKPSEELLAEGNHGRQIRKRKLIDGTVESNICMVSLQETTCTVMREASRSESETQRDSFSALNKFKEQCSNTIAKKQKKAPDRSPSYYQNPNV